MFDTERMCLCKLLHIILSFNVHDTLFHIIDNSIASHISVSISSESLNNILQ